MGSIGDHTTVADNSNTIMLIDDAIVKPLSSFGTNIFIKEKMLAITSVLGINLAGSFEEVEALIRELLGKENLIKSQHKNRKKAKGSTELVDLISTMSYDR